MSLSDCGCTEGGFPSTYPSSQSAACLPNPGGSIIHDERYRTLVKSAQGQLLVVPLGGNSQSYLSAPDGSSDYLVVIGPDGQARPTKSPQLVLTLANPQASGSYPIPSPFPYLIVGGAGGAWRMVAAPTAGELILQVKNGNFVLVDAGQIPGLATIGASADFTAKGQILTLTQPTPGTYVVKKLAVVDDRVIVGDVDVDGNGGYKSLAADVPLTHPLLKIGTKASVRQLVGIDGNGDDYAGGLNAAIAFGTGAVTDGVAMIYSPGAKMPMLAPPLTASFVANTTQTSATTIPASTAAMPNGHGAGTSLAFHYPRASISFRMALDNPANAVLGLFRDGALIQEFKFRHEDGPSFIYLDNAVPLGNHTYSVQWRYLLNNSQDDVIIFASELTVLSIR